MRSNDPRQKERNQSTAEDACTRGDPPLDAQALDLLGQALSRPPPAKIPVHSVRSFGYPIGESTCWFVHFCHRDPPPRAPGLRVSTTAHHRAGTARTAEGNGDDTSWEQSCLTV